MGFREWKRINILTIDDVRERLERLLEKAYEGGKEESNKQAYNNGRRDGFEEGKIAASESDPVL